MNKEEQAEKVREVLFRVVSEINQQLPRAQRLEESLDTTLTGPGGKLDSLGLINFIVSAEERLSEELGIDIPLTDESLGPEVQKTFRSLRSVVEHVCRIIELPPKPPAL